MNKIIEGVKKHAFGDSRTSKVSLNIIAMGVLQAVNMVVGFLLVPMVMRFVSPSQYGIWLTISSMVEWLTLFDIGLGSGMKNRLTESLAMGDKKAAKEYVSTTYFSIAAIAGAVLLVFYVILPFVSWSSVYNQEEEMNNTLMITTSIVVSFFFIRMALSLIGTVMNSYLKPALGSLFSTLSSVLMIVTIWVLMQFMKGDLVVLSIVMSSTAVLVYGVASIILYSGKYKEVCPSIKYFRRDKLGSVLNLGIKFFIIHISMIMIFQTNNFIIIHSFENENVVQYNIAYKLFSVVAILFNLISQPFWTAYTDAWTKKDTSWIKSTLRKILILWSLIIGLGLLFLIFSPFIYRLWVSDMVQIPFILSLSIFIYFISHTYGGVYNMFINGTGKVHLQVICLAIVAVIYIPMVYFFIMVLNLGLISIPLAQLVSNFYSLFIARIQYKKLINGTATGIWNK